jgi:peptide-methionine (S)-S-oxide reductase
LPSTMIDELCAPGESVKKTASRPERASAVVRAVPVAAGDELPEPLGAGVQPATTIALADATTIAARAARDALPVTSRRRLLRGVNPNCARAVHDWRDVVSPEQFPQPTVDLARATASEGRAVLAGGCFWCVEAVYRQLDGVHDVVNGYAGGNAGTADYRAVSSGRTGHAEAVEVRYDPARVSYGELLRVFFSIAHDPTTKDRQGADVGPQYRSEIFARDAQEEDVARRYIAQLDSAKVFDAPIVTIVSRLTDFYPAEDYHQDYAAKHANEPYIQFVAAPKVAKLRKYFKDRLKAAAR